MDWERRPSGNPTDPNGIGDLLARAHEAIGGPPLTGTRFVHTPREMLASTRQIEAQVSGVDTTLYVGFQRASRLDSAHDIYRGIVAAGTDVVAFGVGEPQPVRGLEWVEIDDRPLALENQWYLVTQKPEPVAFVGFETSPSYLHAAGPAASPGKTWEGFVSSDQRLVDALVEHLEKVRAAAG